jgi:hypothetical protein
MLTTFGKTAVLENTVEQSVRQDLRFRKMIQNTVGNISNKRKSKRDGRTKEDEKGDDNDDEREIEEKKNFRLFEVQEVKEMLIEAGFTREKVKVELVGTACIIAKVEK